MGTIALIVFFISQSCLAVSNEQKGTIRSNCTENATRSEYTINETPIFICRFPTTSLSQVKWVKDGQPLPNNPRITISQKVKKAQDNGVNSVVYSLLQINKVQIDDSGTYSCSATLTSETIHNKGFCLFVTEPTTEVKKVKLLQPAILSCSFTSKQEYGIPQVIWLKDGLPIPFQVRYKFGTKFSGNAENNSTKSNILKDADVQLKKLSSIFMILMSTTSDSGKYTCRFSNSGKNLSHDVNFLLIVEEQKSQSLIVPKHEKSRLFCPVIAHAPANIVWKRNGQLLHNNSKFIISNVQENSGNLANFKTLAEFGINFIASLSRLEINDAQLEDSGNYNCFYENPSNYMTQMGFSLLVAEPETKIQDAIEGEAVNISCTFSYPEVKEIYWMKDGQFLPNKSRYNVSFKSSADLPSYQQIKNAWQKLLYVHKSISHLTFENALKTDIGIYTCYMDIDPHKKARKSIILRIKTL